MEHIMSKRSDTLVPGFEFSTVLDPHRRASMERAIKTVFDQHDEKISIALIGWQAATFINILHEHASHIVVIEPDADMLENLQRGLIAHDLGTQVSVIQQDPTSAKLDQRVDLAIFSACSTWFMEGNDDAILKNIHQNIIKQTGTVIPRRFVHLFELAAAPTEIGGIPVRVSRFSRPGEPIQIRSESKHFMSTDFQKGEVMPTEVDDNIIVKPLVSGTITALRLTTLIELAPDVMQTTSQSGVQSIIVPLREDVFAHANQPVSVNIRYKIDQGLSTTRFSARALAETDTPTWQHANHAIVHQLKERVTQLIDQIDTMGRASDLDKVVSYTVQPHGDVSRLTAFFWTIDDDFRSPLQEIVESFRREASTQLGHTPADETIYDLMLDAYQQKRAR